MRKVISLSTLFTAVSALLISCSSSTKSPYPGYTEQDGLYIKYHSDNDTGRQIQIGDIVSLNMMYKTESDSVIMDSKQSGQPVQLRADSASFKGDILGAFIGMNVGDSASIIVSADSFFLKTARMRELPDFVDSASNLFFDVSILTVQSMEEMQAEQQRIQEERMQAEMVEMDAYLKANEIDVQPTESGLIFISKQKGTGKKAEAGMTVKVHYAGQLLDGTYFDTSIKDIAQEQGLYDERREPYEPLEFPLGQGRVIPGWDEGIGMMRVGGKARLIIPSKIAYGANPRPGGPIKPYSTLIFDVELIDVTAAE